VLVDGWVDVWLGEVAVWWGMLGGHGGVGSGLVAQALGPDGQDGARVSLGQGGDILGQGGIVTWVQ
jgi:hypothetical protein